MIEALIMTTVGLSGALILRGMGIRDGLGVMAVSFPFGVFAYIVAGALLIVFRLPAFPEIALGCVVTLALLVTLTQRPKPCSRSFVGWFLGTLVMFAISAVLVRRGLATLTVDSFAYLTSTGLLAEHGSLSHASGWLTLKRGFAIPYLHGLGTIGGAELSVSVTPLLAMSGCLAIAWIGSHAWRTDEGISAKGCIVITMTVVSIATVPRFVFSATYVHTHMLFAVATVLVAGMAWLTVATGRHTRAAIATCVLGTVVLALVRAEGAIFAILLLVPILASAAVPIRKRIVILALYGGFTAIWNSLVVGYHNVAEQGIWRFEAWGLALVGVAAVGGAVLLWHFPRIAANERLIVHGAHGALWFVLGLFVARDPLILETTLAATWENAVSEGLWGPSLFFLAALALIAVVRSRHYADRTLWFPVLAFLPFFLLLTYLREGPYRVGPGDSGTRMLLHVLLLLGLWVIITLPTRRSTGLREQELSMARRPQDADVVLPVSPHGSSPNRFPEQPSTQDHVPIDGTADDSRHP